MVLVSIWLVAKIICEHRIDFDLQLYVYLIKAKAIVMK